MGVPAFLGAAPLRLRFSATPTPNRKPLSQPSPTTTNHRPTKRPYRPTCGISKDLATAAAAAVTLSLSCLPIRPKVSDAIPHPHHHQEQPVLIVNSSQTINVSNPLAVVGVGKAAIHDYGPYGVPQAQPQPAEQSVSRDTFARSVQQDLTQLDDDARREFSLAVRLVTAVLLGVMLGVERRATSINLGVRSITLISLCTAMVSLMATGGEMTGLGVTLLTMAPRMTVIAAAALSGLAVYVAARMRQRPTRHIAAMSWTVALGVGMGGACGAGLSLLTVACYLAAVAVMRSDSSRRLSDRTQHVMDSSVVRSRNDESVGFANSRGRMPLDPLINVRHGEGMDGTGFST